MHAFRKLEHLSKLNFQNLNFSKAVILIQFDIASEQTKIFNLQTVSDEIKRKHFNSPCVKSVPAIYASERRRRQSSSDQGI